jgi:hypothetical protein
MSEHDEHDESNSGEQAASAAPKLSEGLKKFMVALASDVGKLTAFMVDQNKAFDEAGLSQEQRELLLSGDQSRIYAALKDLPLPPAAAASAPAQMPTVVAALNYQGQGASAASPLPQAGAAHAAQPAQNPGQLPSYYVLQPAQPGQWWQQQAPPYQSQPYVYYVVQWPTWPPVQ